MRRRSLLILLTVPLMVAGCGTDDGEDRKDIAPSSSQVTFSLAEREWLLSSPEQQRQYCTDYAEDKIQNVKYFALGDDAGESFVEDFLALLRKRC